MHNFDPIVDGKKDLKTIFNIALQYSEWFK